MAAARLKHFGWGREGEGLTPEEEAFVVARAEARFGTALTEDSSAPRLEDIQLELARSFEHEDRLAALLVRQRELLKRLDLDKDEVGSARLDGEDARQAA